MRTVRLLLLVLLLAGCQTLKVKMNSWVGHHRSELYRTWGEPLLDDPELIVFGKHATDPDGCKRLILYYFFLTEDGKVKSWHILINNVSLQTEHVSEPHA